MLHPPLHLLIQDLDTGRSRHSRNIVPPLGGHKSADVGLPFRDDLVQLSLATRLAQLPHATGILARPADATKLEGMSEYQLRKQYNESSCAPGGIHVPGSKEDFSDMVVENAAQ